MFAGGFFRGRAIRRVLGFFGALLALLAGLIGLIALSTLGIASLLGAGFQLILVIGAFLGAWWIHNASKAILFPRTRLSTGGFVTAAVGVLMLIMSRSTEGYLAIVGGVLALVATIL